MSACQAACAPGDARAGRADARIVDPEAPTAHSRPPSPKAQCPSSGVATHLPLPCQLVARGAAFGRRRVDALDRREHSVQHAPGRWARTASVAVGRLARQRHDQTGGAGGVIKQDRPVAAGTCRIYVRLFGATAEVARDHARSRERAFAARRAGWSDARAILHVAGQRRVAGRERQRHQLQRWRLQRWRLQRRRRVVGRERQWQAERHHLRLRVERLRRGGAQRREGRRARRVEPEQRRGAVGRGVGEGRARPGASSSPCCLVGFGTPCKVCRATTASAPPRP